MLAKQKKVDEPQPSPLCRSQPQGMNFKPQLTRDPSQTHRNITSNRSRRLFCSIYVGFVKSSPTRDRLNRTRCRTSSRDSGTTTCFTSPFPSVLVWEKPGLEGRGWLLVLFGGGTSKGCFRLLVMSLLPVLSFES